MVRKTKDEDDKDIWLGAAEAFKPYHHKKTRVLKKAPVAKKANAKKTLSKSPDHFHSAKAHSKKCEIKIDAKIDLHGMKEEDAYKALVKFLNRCIKAGIKTALVITGKGSGGCGVLKRNAPLWLEGMDDKKRIKKIEQAPTVYGGSGALCLYFKQR